MKILLTGSNGYIGKSLNTFLQKKYNITAITRQDVDLTNRNAIAEWFKNKTFDVIIHAAAVGGNRLIADTSSVLDQNLEMYYNLLKHKDKFNKLLHFGSGAELYSKHTPYGLSKAAIATSIKDINNFYSIRIFAVFDENEEQRRFIKNSLTCYKNKAPIIINQNKKMDFFYMKDLLNLVSYYIENNNLPKTIDCTYSETKSLLQIANFINELDNHKVDILIKNPEPGSKYCGLYNPLIELYGLEQGILDVYKKLDH